MLTWWSSTYLAMGGFTGEGAMLAVSRESSVVSMVRWYWRSSS